MARVLDLIGCHPTSRRGHQLRGTCPFHASEHPNPRSFSVELTRGLFQLLRMRSQGNQLDLWARLHSLPLHKAALDLCWHAGVCVPVIDPDSAGPIAGTPWPARMAPLLAATDIVDGEILFAQGDDAVTYGVGLGSGLGSFSRLEEEVASGILAELVDEDSEAPWGVTEAMSGLGDGEAIDEEGAEGFVLTVGCVGGLEEETGDVR